MRNWMHIMILAMGLLMGSLMPVCAQTQASKDTITPEQQQELWKQEDFVKAYLMISDPTDGVFSPMGHTAIRLVCDVYNLDYSFGYDVMLVPGMSEQQAFALGKVRVAVIGDSTQNYIRDAIAGKRGIQQYELHLPIVAKRKLWQILDEEAAKGDCMSYEFFHSGCALLMSHHIENALTQTGYHLTYAPWEPVYKGSYREILFDFVTFNPWLRWTLMTIYGVEADQQDRPSREKIILPSMLVDVLQKATVNGQPVLTNGGYITDTWDYSHHPLVTPIMVAIFFLLLAIISCFIKSSVIDWVILGVQSLLGLIIFCFLFFVDQTTMPFSWLYIPFNILPLIAWKWRKYWALPYAVLLGMWALYMIITPRLFVDWSHIVFTAAWIVVLVKNALPFRSKKR